MTRAVSTVLDVSLFLLLVSASAFVLVGASPPRGTPAAGPTTNVLAASTATVNYSFAPSGTGGNPTGDDGSSARTGERTAHDTLAGLLAAGAVSDATVRDPGTARSGDGPVNDPGSGFEHAVEAAVADALPRPARTQVIAQWRPYRGSAIRGAIGAGGSPPDDATVGAATMTVPNGLPSAKRSAREAARAGGFDALSRVLARRIVEASFPPDPTRTALRSDGSAAATTGRAYRRTAARLDATVVERDGWIDVDATNDRLTAALAPGVESDLRSRYGTATAAARTVAVGRVRITVRTWSA